MLETNFAPWPSYTQEEVDAVSRVLLSNKVNYWTGKQTRHFESEFAQYCGVQHAVAMANGTLALDVALKAVIKAGDDVIVTPRTFIASASCIVMAGARPIFADVDASTQNITAESIAAVLTPKTTAIIVVHLAGMPADMDPIMTLAEKHGIKVIEDCAQAHGARYKGRSVGSIGHIGAWSFCQDKIMSTGGEGGMVTTNDRDLWSAMWSFKDHGKAWDEVYADNNSVGFRWVHETIGTNWRMTEMQAVIGRIQLRRLEKWQAQRLSIAERVWNVCAATSWLRVPPIPDYATMSPYRAYAFVKPDNLPDGWGRDTLLELLQKQGIPALIGSCPEVYLEKAFNNTNSRPEQRLPVAKELGETSIAFLCHPTMTEHDVQRVLAAIQAVDAAVVESGCKMSRDTKVVHQSPVLSAQLQTR